MKLNNYEVNVLMIKVFSKKEYRDDFIKGHLYLNETAYFNKLEDKYRGDKYDSKIVEYNPVIYINGQEFHPSTITYGFVNDDKIPILSMTILNSNALIEIENGIFQLKREVVDELSQFGEYALLFYYGEIKTNIDKFAASQNWEIDQAVVEYVDMANSKNYLKLYKGDIYKRYFVKDISYKNQNETRFIFLSSNTDIFQPLIPENANHIEIDIAPLTFYYEFNINNNLKIEIKKRNK